MQHGYYIPAHAARYGDDSLSKKAYDVFNSLGLDHEKCERFDGSSIFKVGDKFICRVVLQNFFNPELDVKLHDYPVDV
jgi:hypothetical protein